jgi:hypothetical protein
MIRIPAPLRRGLTVLAIGATVVASHAAFAAPGLSARSVKGPAPIVLASRSETASRTRASEPLPENCYFEAQAERAPGGKPVSKLVQECD